MAEQLQPTADRKKLEREACDRLADARIEKSKSRIDIEECYYFAAPRRVRSASSQTRATTRPQDGNELQTSLAMEVADDFMTMVIDSFMPRTGRWAERRADPYMSEEQKKIVANVAGPQDENIFEAIRGSNFYAELGKGGVPDGSIGVMAMDIKLTRPGRPAQCLAIPIRELEINLGPDGRIDDRFIIRASSYRKLPALLRDITLPEKIQKRVDKGEKKSVEVRWGHWRLWDRDDDEYWQRVVMVDDQVVHHEILKGEGSCPLVIGRFGATPDFAWPDGPMIKSLPDLRQVDDIRAGFVENIDFALRAPFTYDDDGVLSFEDGIEPGMGYPRRPGSTRPPTDKIYEPNPLDSSHFEEMQLEKRIRRLHYVDFPEQLGKTPPTASQWLDEMVEAQKKIGTPGYSFWREFPYEVFQRFRFIAEQSGLAKPLEIDGKKVSLQAYNPAERAQENQDVLTATRVLQIGGSVFPQTMPVMVDDRATMDNIKAKLGDKIVVMRDPDQLAQTFDNMSKLAGVIGPRLPGGLTAAATGGSGG